MKKLKAVEAKDLHIGCMNCSTACLKAPMGMLVAVGFGMACVTKDGKCVWMEQQDKPMKRVRYFEKLAKKEPDCDWRIIKHGPMHGETFQRQGKNNWICVESNNGFA
jgi:hypothetical protein